MMKPVAKVSRETENKGKGAAGSRSSGDKSSVSKHPGVLLRFILCLAAGKG